MDKHDINKTSSIGALPVEFKYLFVLIQYRILKTVDASYDLPEPIIPPLHSWSNHISSFIVQNKLSKEASVLLIISLTPYLYPHLFDDAIGDKLGNMNFPKIGGTHGKNFRGFLPTGETAFFLLAGDDPKRRSEIQMLFGADYIFAEKKVLWLEDLPEGEPHLHGRIIMSKDYVDLLSTGKHRAPHFSISFPAKRVTTDLNWDDLVINHQLQEQIDEILHWIEYNDQLVKKWGMGNRLRKGYRTLFYGPPGTGKTLTAALLGKQTGKEVYKIDLSMVVSKYIGETEKNLELLFARAEDKGWILFFDEADALFGKRTNVRDAHDKYANQEVSYLLQRIEDYDGLIILATNMKNNIDDAFIRRFNSILKFPMPDAEERLQIWKKTFPRKTKFFKKPVGELNGHAHDEPEPVDVPDIVKRYELSGGNILNVVHYASIKAANRMNGSIKNSITADDDASSNGTTDHNTKEDESLVIYQVDVLEGIKRELSKDGIPFLA